jgi:ubiquinone/menaquinone biosynthesis C-methylase UbiE
VGLLQRFLRRYARREARALAPHVVGKCLLDLGSGEGWVGAALRELAPIRDCGADVAPFRLAPGPYVVYDGARLPFADRTFDTTLISLALHHCDAPEVVLAEAIRVTCVRLLVVESVYRSRSERFWLDLLDARLNRHRHGGRMSAPVAFKPPEAWQSLFESHGLAVVATEWLGSRLERLVHHPLLFVLDRPGDDHGIMHHDGRHGLIASTAGNRAGGAKISR